MERAYLCIDLKSFYASVECVERGLDPMTTNLVVADPQRSTGTLCLAVSPSMKALGVRNRCRVYEIPKSIPYIMAPPRMKKYIEYAAKIYGVYLQYMSPDDIHVYSIDEAFLDVTPYLSVYHFTPRQMAHMLMEQVRLQVGVRATCGIGTNLYLAKIALDITAKHAPDFIGELTEESYRRELWDHRPLTDFWRIGNGTAERLAQRGLTTMRDIAAADEKSLYDFFGIDAELLIDHAWGREPVTIADIKAFKPKNRCISQGQVLLRDYSRDEARLIVREMAVDVSLSLVAQDAEATSVGLYVAYSHTESAAPAKGGKTFPIPTASDREITRALIDIYDAAVRDGIPVRRINISCNIVPKEREKQLSMFEEEHAQEEARSYSMQKTVLSLKGKYGRNAVLRGMDLLDAATARERNHQIGGHKSGE